MTPEELAEAARRLARADTSLAPVIRRVGPPSLRPARRRTHYEHLVASIAYQQVTGKAAETIFRRVAALGEHGRFPTPERTLRLGEARLKAAGLSRQKAAAVLDLARHCTQGTLRLATLGRLDDEAVVAALTTVRGIGRWTAEMVLIFRLGRPDVLPATDYGVQKGLMRLDGLRALPRPADVQRRGAVWAPWRSVASWYLWRLAEGQ
ncbi:MAG: DNA-3-methyladenine glycosylase 2 family protein [Deltaproteobacteria bacterium]|nr:DNA-3-methyladenine glycosylase 2 family protein [Deltaproteobacteria bacterium]